MVNARTWLWFGPIAAVPEMNRGVFVTEVKEGLRGLLRRHQLFRLPVHRHVARFRSDAVEPGADRRIAAEVEVALMGDVGVGVERYVGDGEPAVDEKVVLGEVHVHHAERAIAVFHPILECMALQVAAYFWLALIKGGRDLQS